MTDNDLIFTRLVLKPGKCYDGACPYPTFASFCLELAMASGADIPYTWKLIMDAHIATPGQQSLKLTFVGNRKAAFALFLSRHEIILFDNCIIIHVKFILMVPIWTCPKVFKV